MTRRILAAVLLAGTVGLVAVPAHAAADGILCIGMDQQGSPGRMIGLCMDNPADHNRH